VLRSPPRDFQEFFSRERLSFVRATGLDTIRLSTSSAALTEGIDRNFDLLLGGVEALVAARFHVIVVVFPEPIDGFVDGPDGPQFSRLVQAEVRLARMINDRFSSADVALEVCNELPDRKTFAGKVPWPKQAPKLCRAIRAVAPELTLLVSGINWGELDQMLELRPSDFDANIGFVFHWYEPRVFALQGIPISANSPFEFVQRLPWPPQRGDYTAAVAEAVARIEASDQTPQKNPWSWDKEGFGSYYRRNLKTYFSTPEDGNHFDSRFSQVTRWCDQYDVMRGRIFVTEFGAYGDVPAPFNFVAAANTDRARWAQGCRERFEAAGFRWVWHNLDEHGFGMMDRETSKFDAELLAGLGLVMPG